MFLSGNGTIKWKKLAVAVVATCVLAALGFAGGDQFVQPFFREFDWAAWQQFDIFGLWKILTALSLAIFAVAEIMKRFANRGSQTSVLAMNTLCSILLAAAAVGVLKFCVGRMRPVMFEVLGLSGFNPFSNSDIWHSFPSGHTAAAFAFFVSIGLMYPKYKWVGWTMAALAGIGRVCVGAHWPTDVIFAALIGAAAADMAVYVRHIFLSKKWK